MSYPPPQPPRPSGPPPPKPTPKPGTPRPKAEAEELYPVSELAQMWRCSIDHIYDLIAGKQLRSVQLGTGRAKTRIPASAAAEFIAKRSKGRAA